MREQWRNIPGYPRIYQVSDRGRVRSKGRELLAGNKFPWKVLDGTACRHGYRKVYFSCKEFYAAGQFVHRLVLLAFVGPPPTDRPLVNHKNGKKADNRVSNLEWCSAAENVAHYWRELAPKRKK